MIFGQINNQANLKNSYRYYIRTSSGTVKYDKGTWNMNNTKHHIKFEASI